MGVGVSFSHKNEISTMTHTFLLILCCILPPSKEKTLFCEISSVAIFCKVHTMEEMDLF